MVKYAKAGLVDGAPVDWQMQRQRAEWGWRGCHQPPSRVYTGGVGDVDNCPRYRRNQLCEYYVHAKPYVLPVEGGTTTSLNMDICWSWSDESPG